MAGGEAEIEIGILGPLLVRVSGIKQSIGGKRRRTLLARLAVDVNRVVSADELIECLWNGRPPPDPTAALHSQVARLRKSLGSGAGIVHTQAPGYVLETPPLSTDHLRFAAQTTAAEEASNDADRVRHLTDALDEWRGRSLLEFEGTEWADVAARRLEESRLHAVEMRAEAQLRLGSIADVIGTLQSEIAAQPLRSSLVMLMMRALDLSGREVEALRVSARLRSELRDAGLDPPEAVAELEERILRQQREPDSSPSVGRDAPSSARSFGLPDVLAGLASTESVGRTAERAALEMDLDDVKAGRRRVVLLEGEPGVGKSHLAAHAAHQAAREGFLVFYGRCDEERLVPYQPVVEALAQLDREVGLDVSAVLASLGPLAAELGRLRPELRRPSHLDPPIVPASPGNHILMLEAVSRALGSLSSQAPIVLVVDDLQWATPSTIKLLTHLSRHDIETRLLVIATHRSTSPAADSASVAVLADLRRQPAVTSIMVNSLSLEDVTELGRTHASVGIADDWLAQIFELSGGNALFATELLRELDRQHLLGATPSDDELPIPSTLRSLVLTQIAGLDRETQAILEQASVIGNECDVLALQTMSDGDWQRVSAALDSAVSAGLLDTTMQSASMRIRFRHNLVRLAIYDRLPPLRRADLHRRAINAIASVTRDHQSAVPDLAHHARLALPFVEPIAAIQRLRDAGYHALRRRAPEVAVEQFRFALTILDEYDPSDNSLRCDLLIDLGEAQRRTSGQDYVQSFMRGARLAIDLEDGERATRAAKAFSRSFLITDGGVDETRLDVLERTLALCGLEDNDSHARLLASIAGELQYDAARHERSIELAREAVDVASRSGDVKTRIIVLAMAWDIMWHPRTLEMRRQLIGEMREQAALTGVTPDLALIASYYTMIDAFTSGDLHVVDDQLPRAMQLADESTDLVYLGRVLLLKGTRLLVAGDISGTDELVARTRTIATEIASLDLTLGAMALEASSALVSGHIDRLRAIHQASPTRLAAAQALGALITYYDHDLDASKTALRKLLKDDLEEIPKDATWSITVALCVEAASLLRDESAGRLLYEVLKPFRDQFLAHAAYFLGSVEHLLGQCSIATHDLDSALGHFDRAIDLHSGIGARLLAWRSQRCLQEALAMSDAPNSAIRARRA